MESIRSLLEDYNVDYDGVMLRFMNNEALYLKILYMISKDDNIQKLEQALKVYDYTMAFDAAHTLKGAAANLGLTALEQAVHNIVEPLRNQQESKDYQYLYETIQEEYLQVLDLVRRLKEVA